MTRQQVAPFYVHELLVAAKLSSVGNHCHVTQRMQYRSDRSHIMDTTFGEISVRRPKIQPDRRRQRPCLGLAHMIAQRGGDSGLLPRQRGRKGDDACEALFWGAPSPDPARN